MAIVDFRFTPTHFADVNRIAKNADDFLLVEEIATANFVRTGLVNGIPNAVFTELACDGSGRAKFFESVEDGANNCGSFVFDNQFAVHAGVSKNVTAVPQASFGPISHDGHSSLGRHLPFELGENHDQLDHGFTRWHRSIKLLAKRDHVNVVTRT